MSHISTYGAKITNITFLAHICAKNGVGIKLGEQTVKQFGSNAVAAVASLQIPGWKYDLAVTKDGELKYDNWGSDSDSMNKLGELMQDYNEFGILQELPMEQMANTWTEELKNGDKKLVFEYA